MPRFIDFVHICLSCEGVSPTSRSECRRLHQDVDPYSRKSWALRGAFKTMRSEEQNRTAAVTWNALKSWQASEKPLDEPHGAMGNGSCGC